jgi:hypothetical protein
MRAVRIKTTRGLAIIFITDVIVIMVIAGTMTAIGCTSGSNSGPARAMPGTGGRTGGDANGDTDAAATGGDATAETDAAATMWPPPGNDYLVRLEPEADVRKHGATFIIRRRGNDTVYPHPWDSHECVFSGSFTHLGFLERMDPARALQLYYRDAKSPEGSLLPGRIVIDLAKSPPDVAIQFENFRLGAPDTVFPLEASVVATLRERIARCFPFAKNPSFTMFCEKAVCPAH